jgi:autotransporter strand-loop-strand O-heptosyltransferase
MYKNIKRLDKTIKPEVKDILPLIYNNYINQPLIEIRGNTGKSYLVEFIDDSGNTVYRDVIHDNMWSKLNRQYFHEYTCKVYCKGELIYNEKYNASGKRVYIALCSNSLGDTLAWFPYLEEFRKKHNCKLVASTFHNDLLRQTYPDIEFIKPGTSPGEIYAMYNIGWFYGENDQVDFNRHPSDFKPQPMQKTASDILGLEYRELKPVLNVPNVEKKKKVGLGIHSTAQAKYWNNPTGWQEVTDYLIEQGYDVVIYSREGDGYMGNSHPKGARVFTPGPLDKLIEDMASCEFFIGIGSGLSWLAWSLNIPVVLISGFSDTHTEPIEGITRVINKSVCNSCFNRSRLNAADWNWCPDHKDTPRMFECSKQISGNMVIESIKNLNK